MAHILLNYAFETLERFSTTKDEVGRILGGGVKNRFQGRLEPVKNFLDHNLTLGELEKLVLKETRLSIDVIRSHVNRLTADSEKFTGIEVGGCPRHSPGFPTPSFVSYASLTRTSGVSAGGSNGQDNVQASRNSKARCSVKCCVCVCARSCSFVACGNLFATSTAEVTLPGA